jgi:hypothetical protein
MRTPFEAGPGDGGGEELVSGGVAFACVLPFAGL